MVYKKIVSIKASMNKGLSDELKAAFPNIIPVERPKVVYQGIKDPSWLAGFVSAEGCLSITIFKSSSSKTGFKVQLYFVVTQHCRDAVLIESLVGYLNCGQIKHDKRSSAVYFVVTRFSAYLWQDHSVLQGISNSRG